MVLVLVIMVFFIGFLQSRSSTYSGGLDLAAPLKMDWNPRNVFEAYAIDQPGLDTLAMVVDRVPEAFPYQYGATYLRLLLWPVPRAVWPDKPEVDESGIFAREIMAGAASDRPIGDVGMFYMNFSIPGIILGSLIWGLFHRALYSYVTENRNNKSVAIIYAVTLIQFGGLTNMAVMQWLPFIIPILIALRYIRERAPQVRNKLLM